MWGFVCACVLVGVLLLLLFFGGEGLDRTLESDPNQAPARNHNTSFANDDMCRSIEPMTVPPRMIGGTVSTTMVASFGEIISIATIEPMAWVEFRSPSETTWSAVGVGESCTDEPCTRTSHARVGHARMSLAPA